MLELSGFWETSGRSEKRFVYILPPTLSDASKKSYGIPHSEKIIARYSPATPAPIIQALRILGQAAECEDGLRSSTAAIHGEDCEVHPTQAKEIILGLEDL